MSGAKAAEARILQLNRLYAALSRCTNALVRAASREDILTGICQIAVDSGEFAFAWIGLATPDGRRIVPVVHHGTGAEYLEAMEISTSADEPLGRGPAGIAFREGRPYWCTDFQNDPATRPWQALGKRHGWTSVAALPLSLHGKVTGVLAVYATREHSFDPEARQLLTELAANISFGMEKFARDAERLASESRFRAMFEQAPLGVALIDSLDARILEVNPKYAQIAGRSREDMVRMDWKSITHPDDVQPDLDNMARMNAGETPGFHMRKRYLKPDGTVVWIRMTIAPLRGEAGRPRHLCMIEDVTERDAFERAIEDERQKFRALVDQSLVGIYAFDGNRVTYMNPRAAEIFGYSPEETVGMDVQSFVVPEDRALVQDNIRRRIEGGERSVQYEFRGLRRDGATVLVGVHGATTTVDGRRIILGVLQDITDKRKVEQTVREYVRRLEDAMLGTATTISQMVELRDPYTAGHERRVGELSAAIAAEMGLDAHTQRGLRVAGAVHDVGKIVVPTEILTKPGRLSPLELELVRQHAAQGYEVLKDVAFPWPVAEVARQHHERLDGSGYPRGLKGDGILLEARILAVADVVESMASHRPYRAGLGIDKALAEIEGNAGRLYDPAAVRACLALFRERNYQIPA